MNSSIQSISTKTFSLSQSIQVENDIRQQLIAHARISAEPAQASICTSPNIITEFEVEETQLYLIELSFREEQLQPLAKTDSLENTSIIKQFSVGAKHYALVKTDTASSSSPHLKSSSRADRLSPREQEIVCLIAFGLSNKQIASRLDISIWTVSTHLRRIFIKLQVDTRAAVVYRCADLIRRLESVYIKPLSS